MARSAIANRRAMKVLAGSSTLGLTWGDVNRHPDSLLHSLLSSVAPLETLAADDGAPVELDLHSILSTSRLSGFSHAAAVTVALYRHKHLPVELLSEAAKSHSTPVLLKFLQQLLDFLNLPGPVTKYLPDKDSIPLRCMGVLDLHVEAAAQRAVDLMLGSSMSASDASTLQAAFFCVHVREEVSTHFEPVVYCLSSNRSILLGWPKGSSANFKAGCNVAVQVLTGSSGDGIIGINSSSSNAIAGSISANEVMRSPAKYGKPVNRASHTMLFERINTVLRTALAQVPCNGRTGALQSCNFRVYFENYGLDENSTRVWAVWW